MTIIFECFGKELAKAFSMALVTTVAASIGAEIAERYIKKKEEK